MPDDPVTTAHRCLCRPECSRALGRLYESSCNLDVLAASLGVRWAEACDAVRELQEAGLVTAAGALTPAGLSYARGHGLLRRREVVA